MTPYQPPRSLPPSSKSGSKRPSAGKRFFRTLLILLLLLGVGTGAAYGYRSWSNHQKVLELQAQMAANFQQGPGQGGRERFREVRKQVDALPAAYQKEFRQGMRDMFQERMEKRMTDYLDLDKEARRADVLRQYAEEQKRQAEREKRRKEREAEAAKNGTQANQRGNGSGGNGGPGSGNGQPGSGGNNGQGGPGGGRGGGLAARLDNSTPQFRATMAEYIRDVNQIRRDEGLPPLHFGRRPWH